MAEPDRHHRHLYEGEPDEDLVESLEPDQLVAVMEQRLPRARLGRPATLALWTLRVALVVVTGMVVYTFVVSIAR
ncbi:MAG: hypothetical protein ACREPI_05685 [Candidatus Dormibacterales bacterium]